MERSESIVHLAQAMMAAQAAMPKLELNAYNSFNQTHYTDMGEVVRTAMPILRNHGLVLMQPVTSEDERIGVETIIIHAESGEFISVKATMATQPEKGKSFMQVAGSAVSYLRRYGIISALVMYSDENEQAAGGSRGSRGSRPAAQPAAPQPGGEPAYKFSAPEIVKACAATWKCSDQEAAVSLFAHEKDLPKTLTVKQAQEWAMKNCK